MKKVVASLVALAVATAIPVMAFADATPYASIRMETMYVDVDIDGGTDTTDLKWNLQGNTRLGVKFKVSDQVSGKVELATRPANVALRLAYGVYDFGAGTLTIGQDYAPFDWGYAAVAAGDNDGAGYGALAISRSSQITVRLDQGLYVSLIDNPNENADDDDVTFPLLAVGFDGKIGSAAVGFGAGYATYEKEDGLLKDDANTYFVYAQGEVPAGPATIAGKIYYGQNVGEIGAGNSSAKYTVASDDNADTIAGFVSATTKINDKIKIVGGVGYLTTDTGVSGQDDDDQINYFVDLHVKVTKGFTIKPTIAVFDDLDEADGTDGDKSLYAGAQWRFDL